MKDRMDEQAETPPARVLAAVERAALHRARPGAGAPFHDLRAHLALPARSGGSAALRLRLAQLEREGLLPARAEHGRTLWSTTPRGRALLARSLAAGRVPALPESPQHSRWRRARTLARIEAARLAADLADSLRSCELLLSRLDGPAARRPSSDEWFALAERLHRACRRVGSAQHVLLEWPEPEEARADLDDLSDPGDAAPADRLDAVRARRAGRRNTRLWRDPG